MAQPAAVADGHVVDDNPRVHTRRRVGRACDHCNQSRRKCDGRNPCGYCLRTQRDCEYQRLQRRRGKPGTAAANNDRQFRSAKDVTEPANLSEADPSTEDAQNNSANEGTCARPQPPVVSDSYDVSNGALSLNVQGTTGFSISDDWNIDAFNNVLDDFTDATRGISAAGVSTQLMPWSPDQFEAAINVLPSLNANNTQRSETTALPIPGNVENTNDATPREQQPSRPVMPKRRRLDSDISIQTSSKRPRTSSTAQEQHYPVLNSLLPALREFMPDSLSFGLLEAYFETWSLHGAPKNPLVPSSVFQKRAVLDTVSPRPSSNVLLASMLWLAAQNADVPALSASLGKRKYVRRKLLQLTTKLLKPLSEVAFSGYEGMADSSSHGITSQYLDECMAYVHLAMVTSASAFTRASLRWWNMAFSLAREIDLHQPLLIPESEPESRNDMSDCQTHDTRGSIERWGSSHTLMLLAEERKRVWWFLYTMDRHISFLFNKPLSLLDSQCSSLERPIVETSWQGNLEKSQDDIASGPWYYCTGTDFFQFFTPLMALLGETVYFTLAQNHPRFGISVHTTNDWSNWRAAICEKLQDYQNGIEAMRDGEETSQRAESANSHIAGRSVSQTPPIQDPRSIVVFSYAEFLVDVFHIILAGKWDPQTLLEQHHNWLGSKEFSEVLDHVVDAAAAMRELFDLDPGLRFMPFYLGIYLFHVSLPLVLVVDRKHQDVSKQVIVACDTFIRAHEICISHMPSEYLIAMLTVLRTAKTEMQGKIHTDVEENATQRRRLLQKFDWASEGRGVAS